MNIDRATVCVLCFLEFCRNEYLPAFSVSSQLRPLFTKVSAGGSASQGGGNVGEKLPSCFRASGSLKQLAGGLARAVSKQTKHAYSHRTVPYTAFSWSAQMSQFTFNANSSPGRRVKATLNLTLEKKNKKL